jgi:glucose/arabinose dehydrogenase
MVNRVSSHAAQRRAAAGFSPACLLATLMLVASAPLVSAQTDSCGGDNVGITLPPSFCATIFADNLGHARQMGFGPNGVLYLNTWSGGYYQNDKPPDGGFLVALKDTKGDDRADMIERFGDGFAQGSASGTGIRVYGRALFVEQNDKIIRYPLPANVTVPSGPPQVVVSGLPLTGDHPMHPFIISDDADLFVDLGSATNSCQKENRIANSLGYQPCIEVTDSCRYLAL